MPFPPPAEHRRPDPDAPDPSSAFAAPGRHFGVTTTRLALGLAVATAAAAAIVLTPGANDARAQAGGRAPVVAAAADRGLLSPTLDLAAVPGVRAVRLESLGLDVAVPTDATPAELTRWADQRASRAPAEVARHPERISMNVSTEPFVERVTGRRGPAVDGLLVAVEPGALSGYLAVAEPGRIFDARPAALGTPAIRFAGESAVEVHSGSATKLRVRVLPEAPVSFTALDGGAFQNGLNAITVLADRDGVASAVFTATPDVHGLGAVAAASPLTSGRVSFLIDVADPADARTSAR